MKASTQTFNISFPRELVEKIDKKAKEQFGSRSDFMRAAVLQYLRNEEEWEYIFREGKKIGAQAQRLSEEEVADLITKQRRKKRTWRTSE